MNLITDPWIPVIRKDGMDTIMPWQIAEAENPVIEINAPRPDFQGALYQFLIGLLQTCFAPKDEDEWIDRWKDPPQPDELAVAFDKVKVAFELHNPDGPAFMQDYEIRAGKNESIEFLVIGAPGENTIKNNIDLFQKRNTFQQLCESCTAMALFTLQTNGPPGGAGHMAGLRGNGPLTTLAVEQGYESILFKSLWLNVLPYDGDYDADSLMNPGIFPWLAKTKTSESCKTKKCKTGCSKCGTFPSNMNSLHYYWSMPRRIRLLSVDGEGECDLCGEQKKLFSQYVTKTKGFRYVGGWEHPLTPYQKDKEKLPNPVKGQKAGISYQHWAGLVLQDTDNKYHAAKVVSSYLGEKSYQIGKEQSVALWCFGFDMEPGQAKARCWYDQILPLFYLDKDQKKNLLDWSSELILAARDIIKILRVQVKHAWFRRPTDVKGDMSIIDAQFWQATEPDFYKLLDMLAKLPGETRMAPPEIYLSWFQTLEKSVFQIFEKATLESTPEHLDLKRIISAQQILRKKFYGNKTIKNLKAKATHEEAADE